MTLLPFSARFRRSLALSVFLPSLLVACGAPEESAVDEEVEATDIALEEEAGDTYIVDEDEDDGETVIVVEVPVAATTSTETVPLSDAALIAALIAAGDGIERVRHGDGWAWRQQGRIIRTASDDGRRVAYFRSGSDTPFLVQQNDRAYAYSNGAVTRSYDRNGRVQNADSQDRQAASELVRVARNDRGQAERVASNSSGSRDRNETPSRDDDRRTPGRTEATPTPGSDQRPTQQRTPGRTEATPTPGSGQRPMQQSSSRPSGNADRTPRGDRGSARPSPSPTPTPSPSPAPTPTATPDRQSGPGPRDSLPR